MKFWVFVVLGVFFFAVALVNSATMNPGHSSEVYVNIDEMLEPVRKHFEENAEAKELMEKVKSFEVTR